MKIPVDEIPQTPKEIDFSERVEGLNEIYSQDANRDFRFAAPLVINLVFYRSGQEVFLHGNLSAEVTGCCARCMEDYTFSLQHSFDVVLVPEVVKLGRKAEELHAEDLGLSHYDAEEIDLTPLIREQALLALPTRPLCNENCRGLCGMCGVNLNMASCECADNVGDPRMAIFRTLKINRS